MGQVEKEYNLYLYPATNDSIVTLKHINIYLRLGDLWTETSFVVVEALSVNILIGTNFMDKYVRSIYPIERILKPLGSKLIAILSTEA